MTDGITIRAVTTAPERQACVELQRATWGRDFSDAVPASILQITQKVGGVTAGAFDERGALAGFVFGITGVRDGAIVHWSDMLAVREDLRGRGIGRRLKEFQRAEVEKLGCTTILWTYDPLVARNAHLNFNVLGVSVVEYVRDMYGDTGSDLHRGIGTDRLIVSWPVNTGSAERLRARSAGARGAGFERVEVPGDIAAMLKTRPTEAVEWRGAVRKALESAEIVGFEADTANARGFYIVTRAEAP